MTITAIARNFDGNPNIVTIVAADDNLATITTTGYLVTQAAAIEALQNGDFEWSDTDLVLIYYSPAQIGFFTHDATNNTFDELNPSGGLSDTLQSGNIFVGNVSNVATGVAPSGDVTLSNAGVFGIASGVIVNSDVNASAAIDYSKLATLSSGNILVGSAGNVPTSVAMSGDITIGNTGVTAIGANKVLSSMVSPLLLQYTTVTITAAQFNGMYAAPKLLLAAQGANTLIVLERAVLEMTFVSAAYAAGGVVSFQYDSTVHGAGVAASNTEAAADFFAAASTAFQFNGVSGNTVGISPFSTSVNKGLYLSNLTQAFTTGDSTFVVHLWYHVIPTV